jgi:hypothetical protein
MSNLSELLQNNSKQLKTASLHYKIYYILLFVFAGIAILIGLPLILLFGLGLVYIGGGVLYIFLALTLKKSQESIATIANNPEMEQDDFNTQAVNSLAQSGKFFKIVNIAILVGVVLGIIACLILVFALGSLMSNQEFQKSLMMGNTGSSYNSTRNKSKMDSKMNMDNSTFNFDTPEGNMTMDKDGNIVIKNKDGSTMNIATSQNTSSVTK